MRRLRLVFRIKDLTVKLPINFNLKLRYASFANIFGGKVPPRILLYYYAIPIQLAAAAIAGLGFVLYNPIYLLSGSFLWIIWFVTMFFICIPAKDRFLDSISGALKKGAMILFIVILLTALTEGVTLIAFHNYYVTPAEAGFQKLLNSLEHGFGYNDSTALSHQAAEKLLQGKNPYKYANVVEALLKFSPYPDRVTPLRVGQFADQFPYPSPDRMKQVWQQAIKNPEKITPEYANNLVYPAGDFLLPAAFMAIGITDIRITYAILIVLALGFVAYRLKPPHRYYFIGALLMSLELWNGIANGETGILVFPFLLLAWFLLKRNFWFSALFMGIAIATKQTAWFFLPFYLIMAYKTYKLQKTLFVTAIAAGLFLAANIPFMVSDLRLWFNSVFTPMNSQMFPLGVGPITLVTSGLVDIRSPFIFDIMEFDFLALAVIWYFRYYQRYSQLGPVLSIFPLFFAWRSLWPYFFYTGIIVLALMLDEENLTDQNLNLKIITKN